LLLEFRRDYMGWRAGEVYEVDFGLADILVQRQIARQHIPSQEPEEPPKRPKPSRAVSAAHEKR